MPAGLLLTPGAGSNASQPTLVAIQAALLPFPVERVDFPYQRAGRKAPDRPPVLLAAIDSAAAATCQRYRLQPDQLVLGGRSMGGRMCSMTVAQGLAAAGLVLLSYPLHPPGRPHQLRVEHFPDIDVPCLFVSGTKDPFGTPAELEEHTTAIAGPVTHVWIDGAGHSPRRADAEITASVTDWLVSLGASVPALLPSPSKSRPRAAGPRG